MFFTCPVLIVSGEHVNKWCKISHSRAEVAMFFTCPVLIASGERVNK